MAWCAADFSGFLDSPTYSPPTRDSSPSQQRRQLLVGTYSDSGQYWDSQCSIGTYNPVFCPAGSLLCLGEAAAAPAPMPQGQTGGPSSLRGCMGVRAASRASWWVSHGASKGLHSDTLQHHPEQESVQAVGALLLLSPMT